MLALAGFVSAGELPSPPSLESPRGTPAQRSQAERKNSIQIRAWSRSLTPEQRAAYGLTPPPRPGQPSAQTALPAPSAGYRWQAAARVAGLSDAEIARLERDGILIEDQQFKEVFELYVEGGRPFFITSDALLNAFNRLFEDTFREQEIRRVAQLRTHLETVVRRSRELLRTKGADFPVADLTPGWRIAQLTVGPALCLLGSSPELFDADVRPEIALQVEAIRRAETQALPAWLGPPTADLLSVDYRRCRPVGFYAGSERLGNYFRAVRWLQSVPFRADRDDELTAIGLLGYGLAESGYATGAKRFFDNYHELLGRPDDRSLDRAAYEFQNFLSDGRSPTPWSTMLAAKRRWLLRSTWGRADFPKLNDALRLPPELASALSKIRFHVLSSYRLPDSLALAPLGETGRLPESLAVAALLGSDFARTRLTAVPEKVGPALAAARADWNGTGVARGEFKPGFYDRYLHVLESLVAPPEPDAPEFLRREAWAAKSCQTVLAGWAQMRHTFTLQAKENINYFGVTETPPGFVEPCPEFFSRLAALADEAYWACDDSAVFSPDLAAEEENLRALADALAGFGFDQPTASAEQRARLPGERVKRYGQLLDQARRALSVDWNRELPDQPAPDVFQAYHRDLLTALRQAADRTMRGERSTAPQENFLRRRWEVLRSALHRLEALAHKQLRQQPWTEPEADFIRHFGSTLGFVIGYFGNAWLTPNDDAPRWVAVSNDPSTETLLAVAIGRPRMLHVVYPWQGSAILCQGAVMTYYDYPEKQRLTDAEWRAKLDSPAAPPGPAWLAPYVVR